MPNFRHLSIASILKIQSFPLLIFTQKSFQFLTPFLIAQQPVEPPTLSYTSIFQNEDSERSFLRDICEFDNGDGIRPHILNKP